jgi:type I restriction enzyme R subunit
MTKTETYEEWAKALFTKEPANMKLLVVVDKLLTGFDAPPCTYLYIDKSMQDHGLFQAICRVNRLDGEDKDFGYIVDYKDLFKKVENAIAVYTSELDHSAGGVDPEVLLKDRLRKGKNASTMRWRPSRCCASLSNRQRMNWSISTTSAAIRRFRPTSRSGNHNAPRSTRRPRPLVRAYANIADELEQAGYSSADVIRIKQQLNHYLNVREIIRKASGESLDLKAV